MVKEKPLEPLSPMDMAWREFVQALPAWQYHLLMKGETEMILHDDFCSGIRSIEEIRLTLSYEPTNVGSAD
jgi:hypothetical protein